MFSITNNILLYILLSLSTLLITINMLRLLRAPIETFKFKDIIQLLCLTVVWPIGILFNVVALVIYWNEICEFKILKYLVKERSFKK